MLLTISCTAPNATDFGYLLHKHPDRVFEKEISVGKITVFYPEATAERCTVALLLDVDSIGIVRSRKNMAGTLDSYVNDRPYVASSFLSSAISNAFGSALNRHCERMPERLNEVMPFSVHIPVLRCAGGSELIEKLFDPLGYEATAQQIPLNSPLSAGETENGKSEDFSDSLLYSVTLETKQTLSNLLSHLYILLPVLDNSQHYFVGEEEVKKLLLKGENWLPSHPEMNLITRRYLTFRQNMVKNALSQLKELTEEQADTQEEIDVKQEAQENDREKTLRLNNLRMEAALLSVIEMKPPAKRVLDLGCGEGRLLKMLFQERGIEQIVGADVSSHVLGYAERNLHLEEMSERRKERIKLIQASAVYWDERFSGFDSALMIEVIEHLDPPRLRAMERVVFEFARPRRIVITTPNSEYNAVWTSLPAGKMRHGDHRFEWTREEFKAWATRVASDFGYSAEFRGIGPDHPDFGTPTQMAVFDRV